MIPRFSIYSILLTYFGTANHLLSKNYTNETLRNINIQETLTFSKRCKRNSILPRSLLQRPPINTPEGHRIAGANGFRYLNAFIQDGYNKLRTSNRKLLELRFQLSNSLPNYILNDLENVLCSRKINYRANVRIRLQEKFENYFSRNITPPQAATNWVVNLSSYTLSNAENSLLQKGLNFSMPNTKRNIPNFIASIENSIDQIHNVPEEEKSIIRHQVCMAVKSANDRQFKLPKEEFTAMKSLKNNNDITIVPADKGCSVVVIDKEEYISKIQEHLNDANTYQLKPSDTTPTLRSKINTYLKKLFDGNFFTRSEYLYLFANSSTVPLFYAHIKIHKIGNSIRPIVSFIGSPSYNIAKYLSKLLTPSTNKSPHKLINSSDIKTKLRDFIVPSNHILVSFDVKALFTSIPIDFALSSIKTFLDNINNADLYQRSKLETSEIYNLIKI